MLFDAQNTTCLFLELSPFVNHTIKSIYFEYLFTLLIHSYNFAAIRCSNWDLFLTIGIRAWLFNCCEIHDSIIFSNLFQFNLRFNWRCKGGFCQLHFSDHLKIWRTRFHNFIKDLKNTTMANYQLRCK